MRGRRGCHSQGHHGRLTCFADIQSRGKSIYRLIGAVDEAYDGDHRRHADDYADERQDAAQLVRPQAEGGDCHRLGESSLWLDAA